MNKGFFIPSEMNKRIEMFIDDLKIISEAKNKSDVDYFAEEAKQILDKLKNDVDAFAHFEKEVDTMGCID